MDEKKATCINHADKEAHYNSIFAGGSPLCFDCAATESETVIFSGSRG